MEFKDFLKEFINYNKRIYKKIIVIGILLFYFAFLIYFNHFRIILGYELESSWVFGIMFALITTLILVLVIDVLRVIFILKANRG